MASTDEERSRETMVVRSREGVRPILSVGIGLCAACVLAVIMLCGSAFPPTSFTSPYLGLDPWAVVAIMTLAYCVPALASIVVVVMGNLVVPRRLRYVLAVTSWAILCLAMVQAVEAAMVETASPASPEVHHLLGLLGGPGVWLLALLGVMLGFSLPTTDGEKDALAASLSRPARRRHLTGLACLLWLLVVVQLCYRLGPIEPALLTTSMPLVFTMYVVAVPGASFLLAAVAAALLWNLISLAVPQRISLGLRVAAWVLFCVYVLLNALAFTGALDDPAMALLLEDLVEAAPTVGTVVGIVLGIGVGTMGR